MSKKAIIIVVVLLAAIGGGFYYYKYYQQNNQKENHVELTPENLLTLQIKKDNLSPELLSAYQARFEELKIALKQNPDSFGDWLTLAILKKTVGDLEGARDIWLYGAKIRPQSSSPWASLGDLYANFLNDPAQAEIAWKKAIELEPTDYTFYIALAELYRYKITGKEALYEQIMLDAIKLFPDNPNLVAPLAAYYRETKQTQKAIEYYEKLIQMDPTNQYAKDDLAELKNPK